MILISKMNVWMVECNNLTLNNLILAFAIRYPVAYLLYGEIVTLFHKTQRTIFPGVSHT